MIVSHKLAMDCDDLTAMLFFLIYLFISSTTNYNTLLNLYYL